MGIEVKFPFLLLLLIPAIIIVFLFIWKNRKKEFYFIAVLRLSIFIFLILALAVPQILLPVKGETVVFLVDSSESVRDAKVASLDWIDKSVMKIGKDDNFAVVTMGKNQFLEQPLVNQKRPPAQFNGKLDGSETNIEEGLQFASSLIQRNSSGRIILLSDGNETLGNSLEAGRNLKNRNIELDYVELQSPKAEDMSLTALNVPSSMYKGEQGKISLTIDSNASKRAVVRIYENNKEIMKKTVNVKQGKNVFTFSQMAETTGMTVFKGEISANNDAFNENNALYSVSNVKGTPKVLVVQGNESGQIDKVLSGAGLLVDTVSPEKLPTVLSGYLAYQSIILNNVSATVLTENQMNLMERAVKEFGTGFLMAGGQESFGLGGYFKTPIEKLLPVDMDIKGKKEMPSLGFVIVMDRSGSMTGNKIELAKEAAARSVELLREEDTLGFIAFDDRPWEIVETKPLKNKSKVVKKIKSVTPGGGTEIYSSLELAYQKLEDLKLQRKHIILLTDGQSASGGNYETLIEEGEKNNITLSTVALGQDADRGLLEDLATQGSGRFYDVSDSSVIPSILSRETVMATRTYIEDHPFYPKIQPNPDWNSIFEEGVPQMNAYIATTAKSQSTVSLLSEKKDPVLAEWQYGLGRTIAFTSDFSGKWSGDWARWERWPEFINHLVTKTLPQYQSEPYKVTLDKKEGNTIVTLQAADRQSLPIEAAIVAENGERIETNTKLVAPGKYELSIPDSLGMYFLNVKQTEQSGKVHVYQTGFTVPYSDEYLLKAPNKELLKELAKMTGGKELSNEKDSFRPLTTSAYNKQPISNWLILAAFFLFFFEITVRRFGTKRLTGIFRTSQRNVSSTQEVVKKTIKYEPLRNEMKNDAKMNGTIDGPDQKEVKKDQKRHKPVKKSNQQVSPEEKEERMRRLLEAKRRKSNS